MTKNKEFTEELKQAYYRMKKEKGYSLIDRAFKRAYDDENKTTDTVLLALIKKLVPDLVEGEGFDTKVTNTNIIMESLGKRDQIQAPRKADRSLEIPGEI